MRALASIAIFLLSVGYVKIAIADDSQLYYAKKNQIFQNAICLVIEGRGETIQKDYSQLQDYASPNYIVKDYDNIVETAKFFYAPMIQFSTQPVIPREYQSVDGLDAPSIDALDCWRAVKEYRIAIQERATQGPYKRSWYEKLSDDYLDPVFEGVKTFFLWALIIATLIFTTIYSAIAIKGGARNSSALGLLVGLIFSAPFGFFCKTLLYKYFMHFQEGQSLTWVLASFLYTIILYVYFKFFCKEGNK